MKINFPKTFHLEGKSAKKVLVPIFLVLGIIFILLGFNFINITKLFIKTAEKSTGIVIKNVLKKNGNTYVPVIRFLTKDGKEVEFSPSAGRRPPRFPVGEPVGVLYQPSNPSNAKIDTPGYVWSKPIIAFSGGVFYIMVGIVAILVKR